MSPGEDKQPLFEDKPKTCPECNGHGWRDNLCSTPERSWVCMVCNGRGTSLLGDPCSGCGGTGHVETRTTEKLLCPLCCGAGVHPVPPSMQESEFAYRKGPRRSAGSS